MSLSSFAFALFLTVVAGMYWSLFRRRQWLLLLGASYYFYFSWKPLYGLILLGATAVSYLCALAMGRWPQVKRVWLALGLLALFGTLFAFKYANFAGTTLALLLQRFGIDFTLPHFSWLLPLGISFFTFQTAGYLIDVFRGKIPAEKHLGYYALFVSFFPAISAGPIERGAHLLPQLRQPHPFRVDRAVSGLQLVTLGLIKKIVIADNLARGVNEVFGSLPEYRGLSLVLAVILFSWQIYADFSGYTDMARGVARLLGFDLLENFRTPYLATSVRDFWRRWHMSLSFWLRDYVYISLGGSRAGQWRTYLNTFLVFLICGLWHGAAWTFVVWGASHGLLIMAERVAAQLTKGRVHVPAFLATLYTYGVITGSWIFFRASSLAEAMYIVRNMVVGVRNFISPNYIWATLNQMFATNKVEMGLTLMCLVLAVSLELVSARVPLGAWLRARRWWLRWPVYVSALLLILFLRNAHITQFIYYQF